MNLPTVTAIFDSRVLIFNPAADKIRETSTVKSSTGVEDYLAAFLEPSECGKFIRSTRKMVGGVAAKLGKLNLDNRTCHIMVFASLP